MVTTISSHIGLRAMLEDGTLPRQEFEIFEKDLTCVLICPGVRDWWADTQSAYLHWADYLNELISNGENEVPYTESFPYLRPQ